MALTGLWSNGVCAANQTEAISLLASQFPLVEQGIVYHIISIGPASTMGAALNLYASPLNPALATQTVARNVYFAACDPAIASTVNAQMFADGMTMGWGIVAAMFSSLAVVFLIRAFYK